MGPDMYGTKPQSAARRNAWTIVILLACLAIAGTVRIAFNYGPATDDGFRYAGNDDYYHLRVVQHVQAEGNHLVEDPLLNYPVGAKNPRPPVYDWSVAILGQGISFVSSMGQEEAGQFALEWGSAIWGVLIVIPIWLIGRHLFGNGAGLWAAFLIAASPANVQRSGFGLGDHDAFILFFLALGAYFLIRGLQFTREERHVDSWTNFSSVADGFASYAQHNQRALAYTFLAGVSWGTIALMWEGFPYALAIYAIYYFIQVLSNHIRHRDSAGDLMNMVVLMGTVILMALPFYWNHGNIRATVTSANYILLGLIVLTLALVVTRDLPWVLVLPSLFAVGLVGLVVVLFIFPDIGRQLFTANGYFVQNKLYSTIAEAQRTDLGVFVFSVGFMTFFFALVGVGFIVKRVFKTWERPAVFMLGWALVSIYMAFAASRFVYNATPVFAVLGGWIAWRITKWMDLRRVSRVFASMRSEGVGRATRASVSTKVVFGSLFLVMTLLVPNLWFSVDAGIPSEFRANVRENHPGAREILDNRTGAFGQGFLSRDWITVYGWLAEQDLQSHEGVPLPPEKRPAHIAWWDYGFWEVALGFHPTVADNFQNGFAISGRFLAAQSEKEGFDWLIIRQLEAARVHNTDASTLPPAVATYLEGLQPGLAGAITPHLRAAGYDQALEVLSPATADLALAVGVYEDLIDLTGFEIGYFLVDSRMLPFDNPNTPDIESGSIFYAPVFLANKNPDDFIQTTYRSTDGNTYNVISYETDAEGEVQQLETPRIVDAAGQCYFVSGGQVFRGTADCKRIDYTFAQSSQSGGIPLAGTALDYKPAFYETMFYRAFAGGGMPPAGNLPASFNPGEGLVHFRAVQDTGSVKLLKYYPGAIVTGTVVDSDGQPMAGIEVTAVDDLGIAHDSVITDQDGAYELLAPFGTPGENGTLQPTVIRATSGRATLGTQEILVTEAQAYRHGDHEFEVHFEVEPATVTGFVFLDVDHSGSYDEGVDEVREGLTVTLDGSVNTTTDTGGNFTFADVSSRSHEITVSGADHYEAAPRAVSPSPGGTETVEIALQPQRSWVNGTITDPNEEPVASYTVTFTALDPDNDYGQNTTVAANETGVFAAKVLPGSYRVSVNHTTVENGVNVRYTAEAEIMVLLGQADSFLTKQDLNVQRTEEN